MGVDCSTTTLNDLFVAERDLGELLAYIFVTWSVKLDAVHASS
jgi:hypothetical protein